MSNQKEEIIKKIINNYQLNIECLSEYIDSVGQQCFSKLTDETNSKYLFDKFFEDLEKRDKEEGEKTVTLETIKGDLSQLLEKIKEAKVIEKDKKKQELLYRSSLMSLVIFFENMISDIIKVHINMNPDVLVEKKQLTFKEIKSLGSIENAVEYLIEKELEGIIRNNYNFWIKYLQKEMNLKLKDLEKFENDIIEAIQRRNLFVHNNGVVNNIYIQCTKSEVHKKGEKLLVNDEYIKNTIKLFKKVGYIILISFWKKFIKSDKESNIFKIINKFAFEELLAENYDVSECIYKQLKDIKQLNYSDRLISIINYNLSIKYNNNNNKLELEEITDVSALSDNFKIAIYILNGKKEKALDLIERKGAEMFTIEALEKWPIFFEIREEERFKKILESLKEKEELYEIGFKGINFDLTKIDSKIQKDKLKNYKLNNYKLKNYKLKNYKIPKKPIQLI